MRVAKTYARLFLQSIIHVFKVHQRKAVIFPITDKTSSSANYFLYHSYIVTRMSLTRHSYAIRMFRLRDHLCKVPCHSYVTHMSILCLLCVLVCHSYATRMYSHAICMWIVCTHMSLIYTLMSLVCVFTTNLKYFSFSH